MQLLSERALKTFNLVSIGQRGVGKTVFLAGSYAELQANNQIDDSQEFWFDCQDPQAKESMEQLLSYVAKKGQYPPPTMKIANFNFSLKRQTLWSEKSICYFRWWDIPGEICNTRNNRDFQRLVLNSHACCVFINAHALVHDKVYLQQLEDMTRQVMAIASLAHQRSLNYPFALIFTKCDLIQLGPISQLQIEESLQPLLTVLDAVKANYKRFYSAIPIASAQGVPTLKAKGAAAPLLWLTSELRKINKFHTEPELGVGLTQNSSEFTRKASAVKKEAGLNLPPKIYKYIFPSLFICASLIGVITALSLAFSQSTLAPQQAFKKQLNIVSPNAKSQEYTDAR